MAPLKFISFAAPFLVSFHFSHAGSVAVTDCLNAINAPRSLAGLPAFVEKSAPVLQDEDSLCDRVQQGLGGFDKNVTYFYAHQTGDEEDCGAAVAYWRSGLDVVNNQLPPAYKNETEIYKDEKLLGLVGMYNPNPNPTLECKYVKCVVTTTTTTPPTTSHATSQEQQSASAAPGGSGVSGTPADGDESIQAQDDVSPPLEKTKTAPSPGGAAAGADTAASTGPSSTTTADSALEQEPQPASGSTEEKAAVSSEGIEKRRRLTAAETTYYNALVCITTPPVLVENKQPFDQEQWTKIVGSISASSTATVSAFSLVALAGLALYII